MSLLGRVDDPTGKNPNGIWANPLRDIAHCGPTYISVALQAMEKDKDRWKTGADMCEYAVCLRKFVELCVPPNHAATKTEAFKESGLLAQPHDAHCLFGKWLARVFLGEYFDGIGEALHKGENGQAIGVDELVKSVQAMTGESDS